MDNLLHLRHGDALFLRGVQSLLQLWHRTSRLTPRRRDGRPNAHATRALLLLLLLRLLLCLLLCLLVLWVVQAWRQERPTTRPLVCRLDLKPVVCGEAVQNEAVVPERCLGLNKEVQQFTTDIYNFVWSSIAISNSLI